MYFTLWSYTINIFLLRILSKSLREWMCSTHARTFIGAFGGFFYYSHYHHLLFKIYLCITRQWSWCKFWEFLSYFSKILIDTCWFWIFFYQFAKILCQLSTYIAETYSQHLVLSLVGDDLNYSLLLIIRLSEVWMLPSLWIVCLSVEVEIVGTILNIIYSFLWRSQQQAIFYSMIGFTILKYRIEPSLHFLRMFETLSIASLVLPKQLYALGGCHVVQLMNSSNFLRDYMLDENVECVIAIY